MHGGPIHVMYPAALILSAGFASVISMEYLKCTARAYNCTVTAPNDRTS